MFAKAANLHNTGGGIIVTGPAGCGKTAALAHWKRTHAELQARGPKAVAAAEAKVTGHDDSSNTEYVYIEHYLSATPEAAHINGMLPRLYLEIQSLCGLEETMPMPNKAALVRELFPDLCDAAANIMVEVRRSPRSHGSLWCLHGITRAACIVIPRIRLHFRVCVGQDWPDSRCSDWGVASYDRER